MSKLREKRIVFINVTYIEYLEETKERIFAIEPFDLKF